MENIPVKRSIPIIAVGYNRPEALQRLLNSLLKADYPGEVELIISVDGKTGGREDGKTGGRVEEVRKVAQEFMWPFGEKKLIFHEKNLGLRKHVLSCGDLSRDYDGVIVLEDDLYVAPGFYGYALKAFEFYRGDPKIAGISLYSHAYNETAQFPFRPVPDDSDVFFLQYAPSLGQCWGRESWKAFRAWYNALDEGKIPVHLPPNIVMWPETSWKKYFIAYIIQHDLYFVYPRYSMTTLFSDTGTNLRIRENIFQVPLWLEKKEFLFKQYGDSKGVYDVYCEILPDCLKQWNPSLKDHDFETDLYGMKSKDSAQHELFLSSRKCKKTKMTFGREMKPHEMNIVAGIPGDHYSLAGKEDFDEPDYFVRLLKCHEKKELAYWYPIREYHFYKNRLLTTDDSSKFWFRPGFFFRKFFVMLGYTLRYFRKK
jgi:glycosyltransferase involved in cell wall biosynthesis